MSVSPVLPTHLTNRGGRCCLNQMGQWFFRVLVPQSHGNIAEVFGRQVISWVCFRNQPQVWPSMFPAMGTVNCGMILTGLSGAQAFSRWKHEACPEILRSAVLWTPRRGCVQMCHVACLARKPGSVSGLQAPCQNILRLGMKERGRAKVSASIFRCRWGLVCSSKFCLTSHEASSTPSLQNKWSPLYKTLATHWVPFQARSFGMKTAVFTGKLWHCGSFATISLELSGKGTLSPSPDGNFPVYMFWIFLLLLGESRYQDLALQASLGLRSTRSQRLIHPAALWPCETSGPQNRPLLNLYCPFPW